MATKKVKFKVGVFLLVCFGIMIGALVYFSGAYRETGIPYWMEFEESVLGVYEGTIVEYLGLPVGKVAEMSVTPNKKAHIEIVIEPGKVVLHGGVEAQLVLYSLAAGTMAVELRGGDAVNGLLPPGSEIPTKSSALAAISSESENIIRLISSILEKFEQGLSGMEEGEFTDFLARVTTVVEEVETLVVEAQDTMRAGKDVIARLDERIEPVSDELMALSQNIRKTSDEAGRFLGVAAEKTEQLDVEGLGSKLDTILGEASELTARLNETVANLDETSSNMTYKADNLEYTLRSVMRDASDTLITLESLISQLKDDPSSVVRGRGRIEE